MQKQTGTIVILLKNTYLNNMSHKSLQEVGIRQQRNRLNKIFYNINNENVDNLNW